MTDSMNDDELNPQHELASAYLDGVASAAERAQVEASPELLGAGRVVRGRSGAARPTLPPTAAGTRDGRVRRRLRRVRRTGRSLAAATAAIVPLEPRSDAGPARAVGRRRSAAGRRRSALRSRAARRRRLRQLASMDTSGQGRRGRRRNRAADAARVTGDGPVSHHRLHRAAARQVGTRHRHARAAAGTLRITADGRHRAPTAGRRRDHRSPASRDTDSRRATPLPPAADTTAASYARPALGCLTPISRCSWPTFSTRAPSPSPLAIRSPA